MDFLRAAARHALPGPHNSYRPHFLRRQWLVALLGVALSAEALLVGTIALRDGGVPFLAAVVQSEVVAHTNSARERLGAAPLRDNALLAAAAARKAADMAGKGYFAHTGPDGKTPWEWVLESGYDYRYAGENLAVRFVDSRDVVDAWMGSPSHRANILKAAYTDIGVGVASGLYKGQRATYVVQYFGAPSEAFRTAGAAVVTSDSFLNSFIRQAGQYFADPRHAAAWTLVLVAAALTAAVGLAAARHVQVQPVSVLAPGAAVAVVAWCLLWLNGALLAPPAGEAAAGLSAPVVVGDGAAAERGQ